MPLQSNDTDSIEFSRQRRIIPVPEHELDLRRRRSADRQRRQVIAGKEPDFTGLVAGPRLAADDLADEQQFVNRVLVMQVISGLIIVNGGELQRARLEARFLGDLAQGLSVALALIGRPRLALALGLSAAVFPEDARSLISSAPATVMWTIRCGS